MQSVPLTSFGLPDPPETTIRLINKQQFNVRTTIPYEEVLAAIQWSIDFILDERTFISGPLYAIISDIALVKYWSNITIPILADIDKLTPEALYESYDLLVNLGILDAVREVVSPVQRDFYLQNLRATIDSLVAYRNSAAGILESLRKDAKTDEDDMSSALKLLNDPETSGIVGKVLGAMDLPEFQLPEPIAAAVDEITDNNANNAEGADPPQ